MNLLENHFQSLLGSLLKQLQSEEARRFETLDHLIDSMPVMLTQGSKSKRARVARQIASTGFCATRQTHFRGVRFHLIARRQPERLPVPARLWIERGNTHDLTALRAAQSTIPEQINLFGDKAYADRRFKDRLRARHIRRLTPIKKPKRGELSKTEKLYNQLISKTRQPIESFFE